MFNAAGKQPIATTPMYIFDLDGTLAIIDHRRGLVEKEGKGNDFKPDWDAFFKACVRDTPNWPVIGVLQQLYSVGCEIRIWSGRSDMVRADTIIWLSTYLGMPTKTIDGMLTMRKADDFTPDQNLKKKWLLALTPTERFRLGGVFYDRDKVVAMWRSQGVACFQVAPGAF